MKIVFLDIDGVLRPELEHGMGEDGRPFWRFGEFDPDCVDGLNKITDATGACIVVSSSWKRSHGTESLAAVLRGAGVRGQVVGKTPDLPGEVERPGSMRGHEIAAWLAQADAHEPVEGYIVIDDGLHTSGRPELLARWVQTASAVGIDDTAVQQAIALLEKTK